MENGVQRGVTRRSRISWDRERVKAAADQAMARSRLNRPHEKPWYIVDPRRSKGVQFWDGARTAALIFVALFTPFEIGYLEPSTSALEPVFIVNQFLTLIFVVDLVLQFFVMTEIETERGLRWVSDQATIARSYLKGGFTVDFICVVVSAFDFVTLGERGAADLQDLRLLRILRTLRLIRLIKLFTASKIVKRYEVRVAVNYAALGLVQCILGMLVLSHWFACAWGLQASFQTDLSKTWLGKDEVYCWPTTRNPTGPAEINSAAISKAWTCLPPEYLYSAALYWAVMTVTSIGYGDIAAYPGNLVEQVVATIIMVIGSMTWGLILGTIVSNLQNLNPESDAFRHDMSELNRMMKRDELPNSMRIRLRQYFHKTQHIRASKKRSQLLHIMSPTLRSEVSWEINKEWLSRVWFLQECSNGFLVQLSLKIEPIVFAPGEIAPIGPLYVVNRGLALYGGKVLGRGASWGEDVILSNAHLQRALCALAMNFLDAFRLSRDDLEDTQRSFPSEAQRIRKMAIRLALRRAVVLEAMIHRKASLMDLETTFHVGKGPSQANGWTKMSVLGEEADQSEGTMASAISAAKVESQAYRRHDTRSFTKSDQRLSPQESHKHSPSGYRDSSPAGDQFTGHPHSESPLHSIASKMNFLGWSQQGELTASTQSSKGTPRIPNRVAVIAEQAAAAAVAAQGREMRDMLRQLINEQAELRQETKRVQESVRNLETWLQRDVVSKMTWLYA